MELQFFQGKKATIKLKEALVAKARELVVIGEFTNALDLFLALSIYKCQIQGNYRGNPDLVQVNLIKGPNATGLRIFRIGKGTETASVMQSH